MLLPGVDQLFSEPAGQRLTHPVEQLGQLNVVIPVVLPEERLRLKTDMKKKKCAEITGKESGSETKGSKFCFTF